MQPSRREEGRTDQNPLLLRLLGVCVCVHSTLCRYYPFGQGSGQRIQDEFAIPGLVQLPIREEISAGSDGGVPCVLSDPESEVTARMRDLGEALAEEAAALGQGGRGNSVKYNPNVHDIEVSLCASGKGEGGGSGDNGARGAAEAFAVDAKVVRENDQSAKCIDQRTGKPIEPDFDPHVFPLEIIPLGNYAVQISWSDGFNQIATYEQFRTMERRPEVHSPDTLMD